MSVPTPIQVLNAFVKTYGWHNLLMVVSLTSTAHAYDLELQEGDYKQKASEHWKTISIHLQRAFHEYEKMLEWAIAVEQEKERE